MSTNNEASFAVTRKKDQFYLAAWRWHFYAGLYVVPFLLMLAVTGTVMVYANVFQDRYGLDRDITPGATLLTVDEQARLAVEAVPNGKLVQYIAPGNPHRAGIFNVEAEQNMLVAVQPYTGDIIGVVPKGGSLYALMDDIHGTLLIGDLGDRLIEIAACLCLILVVTGLYLWWPRDERGVVQALLPNLRTNGRTLLAELHVTFGVWFSLVLVLFLLTGLAWAGVWGGKMVQAWSSFPAEKWDDVPLSADSHASLNDSGIAEVPWGLEQTLLPLSRSEVGKTLKLGRVADYARELGFAEQFRINLPKDNKGVFTISADSMDGDTTNPMGDRTLHIDQYSGEVLADIGFDDYGPLAKVMAVGTAFHMGYMGLWNFVLNVVFCMGMVGISLSGIAMWWMRRPSAVKRLVPPQIPTDLPMWKGAVVIMLTLSLMFPMAGVTLVSVMLVDWMLVSRIPLLSKALR